MLPLFFSGNLLATRFLDASGTDFLMRASRSRPNQSPDEFNRIRKLLMDLRSIKTTDLDKALAILNKRSKSHNP
jgi:hypothetical protein